MKIFVCIDDTDNLESRGTGDIAVMITEEIANRGWGRTEGVTRHQLLVHPDIPYTSHNSCMCFIADVDQDCLESLTTSCCDLLAKESAEGSDPGLCIAVAEQVPSPELLIEFGRKAKTVVVTKDEAYSLASQLGVHLSEHGGTGQGIIGALAGIGLRWTGNDGRFKGMVKIRTENNIATVGQLLARTNIDLVKTLGGKVLTEDERVGLGNKVKTVLLDHKCVLLVSPAEDFEDVQWQTCSMKSLKSH